MRLAGLPRFLERHAVAAGFGASVAAHAAIVAGLAWSTAGGAMPGVVRATPSVRETTVVLAREIPAPAPAATRAAEPQPAPSRAEPDIGGAPSPTELAAAEAAPRFTVRPFVEAIDRAARSAAVDVPSEVASEIVRRIERVGRALRTALARATDARGNRSPENAAAVASASAQVAAAPTAEPARPSRADETTISARPSAAPSPSLATPTAPEPEAPAVVAGPSAGTLVDASVLELPMPEYPRRAARLGLEGTVRIEIDLAPTGEVAGLRIVASSGHRALDEAAIAAARLGRYRPATRGGVAIASVLVVPFEFRAPR